MLYLDNYKTKINDIKTLIIDGNYTKAIFDCNNIKKEIIKISLDEEKLKNKNNSILLKEFKNKYENNAEIIEIINKTNNIVRKYDYEHQNVFDKTDATEMYSSILELLKIFSEV